MPSQNLLRHVRRLLIVGLVVAAPASAAAQGLGFGVKVGANFSRITFENDDSLTVEPRAGILAGGFVTLPLVSRTRLEVDVLWSERVSEFEGLVTDKLTYLELPILARLGVYQSESWRVHVIGGVALAFLQKATETISGIEADIKAAVKSQEYGAVIGAEVQIAGRWLADVRYVYGFTNVYAAGNFPAKHRGMQVVFGYRLK